MNLDAFHFILNIGRALIMSYLSTPPHQPLQATQEHYKYDTTHIVWLLSEL